MKTTRESTSKVKKKKVVNNMTCPICDGLYKDATTIIECLHSFCKECIISKIKEIGLSHCPVCSVYLGTTPLEKLRPDHSIQSIRRSVFPLEEDNAKAPAAEVPSVPSEPKRKKKSPIVSGVCAPDLQKSSRRFSRKAKTPSRKAKAPSISRQTSVPPQEVTTPAAAAAAQPDAVTSDNQRGENNSEVEILDNYPAYLSGRKGKSSRRKNPFPRRFASTIESDKAAEENKKDENFLEIETTNETSQAAAQETIQTAEENQAYEKLPELEIPNEISQAESMQYPSIPDLNEESVLEKTSENNADLLQDKAYNLGSFNDLADAASNTRANNSAMHGNSVQPAPANPCDNEADVPMAEGKKNSQKFKAHADDDCEWAPGKSTSMNTRKLWSMQQKRARAAMDFNLNVSEKDVMNSNSGKDLINLNSESNERSNPVWFSLVPAEAREVCAQLPQLSSNFLRVRDGTVPVSCIQKYVMVKLGLTSDIEVEISLKGQPVSSSLLLNNLIEMWKQTVPTREKITASVGISGAEFVMVLNYSRKCYP